MIGFKKNNQKIGRLKFAPYQRAFTLMEVLISVTLFAVIVLSVTGLFKLSIDAQRTAIATQNVQESIKYFLEVVSKEIRMAQKSKGECPNINDGKIYYLDQLGGVLYFTNYYGECVSYYKINDENGRSRFVISRRSSSGVTASGYVSPAKIDISALRFVITNGDSEEAQPMVTINLKAKALDDNSLESEMTLQTSITSRYYK